MYLQHLFLEPSHKIKYPSNQSFQLICLNIPAKASWYITNKLLNDDLQIKTIHGWIDVRDTAIII
jgi:hypothetical protein